MSTPSMRICPSVTSTRRNIVDVKVDFPAPVLPTIPIFSPGWMVQLMLRRTGSRPGLYRTSTSMKSILPSVGQFSGMGVGSAGGSGSCGRREYSMILSAPA